MSVLNKLKGELDRATKGIRAALMSPPIETLEKWVVKNHHQIVKLAEALAKDPALVQSFETRLKELVGAAVAKAVMETLAEAEKVSAPPETMTVHDHRNGTVTEYAKTDRELGA